MRPGDTRSVCEFLLRHAAIAPESAHALRQGLEPARYVRGIHSSSPINWSIRYGKLYYYRERSLYGRPAYSPLLRRSCVVGAVCADHADDGGTPSARAHPGKQGHMTQKTRIATYARVSTAEQ